MDKHFANFFSRQINNLALIVQCLFIGIATMVFLAMSFSIIVFQWNQMNKAYAPSTITVSSSSSSQSEQILSEAQQDVNVANNMIVWSGFFLAIMASAVTVAGFFGIREFLHIRHLSNEFEKQIQAVAASKVQLENEFEKQIQDVTASKTQIELDFQELQKKLANESKTFIEAANIFILASNAYRIGDYAHAIEYYLQADKIQPDNILVMERLGRAYTNTNNMQKAIYYLENKALAIDPSYVPALRSLALCYRYTDKDKAIAHFQRALEIDPSDYETWDFLGLIYRDNKHIDEAISAHHQALVLERRPETQFYLSILYAIKGDMKSAKSMSLNAERDLNKKEHDERIRPVWKDLIRAGVHIIEDNEDEAYKLVETLSPYITTPRVYEAVTGHLNFLLEATGHDTWKQKFTGILIVK